MVGTHTNGPEDGPGPRADRETERERARRAARELALEEARESGSGVDGPDRGEIPPKTHDGRRRAAAREKARAEARARTLGEGPPDEARGEGAVADVPAGQGRSPAPSAPRPKLAPSENPKENPADGSPEPSGSLTGVLARISASDDEAGLRAVVAAARARLKKIGCATVEETRPFRSGLLVLEWRSHGDSPGGPRRGPYWYYRYREDGRGRSIYLGKTDEPEAAAAEKLDRGPALPGGPTA